MQKMRNKHTLQRTNACRKLEQNRQKFLIIQEKVPAEVVIKILASCLFSSLARVKMPIIAST